jgi:hypothetical protein
MKIDEELNNIVRLPKDVLDEISWIPQHLDEIIQYYCIHFDIC